MKRLWSSRSQSLQWKSLFGHCTTAFVNNHCSQTKVSGPFGYRFYQDRLVKREAPAPHRRGDRANAAAATCTERRARRTRRSPSQISTRSPSTYIHEGTRRAPACNFSVPATSVISLYVVALVPPKNLKHSRPQIRLHIPA